MPIEAHTSGTGNNQRYRSLMVGCADPADQDALVTMALAAIRPWP
jgi:hypothetical protein